MLIKAHVFIMIVQFRPEHRTYFSEHKKCGIYIIIIRFTMYTVHPRGSSNGTFILVRTTLARLAFLEYGENRYGIIIIFFSNDELRKITINVHSSKRDGNFVERTDGVNFSRKFQSDSINIVKDQH